MQERVESKHSPGIAQESDDRKNNVGLIYARSPRDGAFGAEIIEQQEKRDAGGQAKEKRDTYVNFGDDHQRPESGGVRNDDCVQNARIPGVAMDHRVFQKSRKFVRPRVPMIAKEETDSQINSGEHKQRLMRVSSLMAIHISILTLRCIP